MIFNCFHVSLKCINYNAYKCIYYACNAGQLSPLSNSGFFCFFVFSALKTETPFLKYRVPLPLSVGIIYTFLHEWPQSRYLIHVKSYTLSFHVRFISFKVLKIHWCYSMSLPTFAISTLYRKCFQFFFLHICSLYIPWILKRHFCSCVYDALPCSLPLLLALVPPVVLLLHSCMYIKFGTYIWEKKTFLFVFLSLPCFD